MGNIAAWIVPTIAIAAWAAMMLYRFYLVGRAREHAHRERMALIERGLVPPPETDPQQFERMTDWHPSGGVAGPAARHRRSGITLIGVGAGMLLMFYVPGVGHIGSWGVGAFLIVLGVAFLVNSMLDAREQSRPSRDVKRT
jgi:purine-cytosine permease-like protein